MITSTSGRFLFVLVLAFAIVCQAHWLLAQTASPPELSATMINVNSRATQGDAHLIQTAEGNTILIDTGAVGYAEREFIPALKKKGIRKIDAVFITHPHYDHNGGMVPLLRSGIKIGAIYMDEIAPAWFQREWWGGKAEDIQAIVDTAQQKKVPIIAHSQWQEFKLSDKYRLRKIMCLRSFEPGDESDVGDMNDMSLVAVLMRNEQALILYAGDVNVKSGNKLKAENLLDFPCEILKFPHHGAESWGGEDAFEGVKPKIIFYPAPASIWNTPRCDRARKFGKKLGAQVYSNAEDGTVTFNFFQDGSMIVETNRVSPSKQ